MSKRTLGGLSSRLLEQVDHEEKEELEKEKMDKDELKEDETEQKENPQLDPEDQDEDEESEEEDTDLIEYLQRRKKRKKQEETHTRKTFLVENDMLAWMKKQAKKYGHGFYTDFVNMSFKLGKEQLEAAERAKKK